MDEHDGEGRVENSVARGELDHAVAVLPLHRDVAKHEAGGGRCSGDPLECDWNEYARVSMAGIKVSGCINGSVGECVDEWVDE